MYKELEEDIPGFVRPKHGHLVGWADQGVLLLNAVLTVRSGNPNSHKVSDIVLHICISGLFLFQF